MSRGRCKNWLLLPPRHAGPPRPERLASDPIDLTDSAVERFMFRADDSLIWSMARDASWALAYNIAMAWHPGRIPYESDEGRSLASFWGVW